MKNYVPGRFRSQDLFVATVVAVLTAAQGIFVVAGKSDRWEGNWASSSAVVGWATLWGACIASAATAWVVVAPRRHGYLPLVRAAARGQVRIYAAALLSVGAGNLLGYLAVLGYVVARTGPVATHGRVSPVELMTPVAAVLIAVGLGAAAGQVLPLRFAPLVAGIAPYVVYMLLVYADVNVQQRIFTDFPTTDQVDRTYLRIPVAALVGRALFWAALGGALVTWSMRLPRRAYTLLLLAGFAASAVLLTSGTRIDARDEYRAICLEGEPRVCVDRAHDHLAAEYQRRIRDNVSAIKAIDVSAVTFVQSPDLFELSRKFGGDAPSVQRTLTIPLISGTTSPAHRIGGASFDASFGFAVFLGPCLERADITSGRAEGDEGLRTAVVLYDWWLGRKSLPHDGSNFPGEINVEAILPEDPGLARARSAFNVMDAGQREAFVQQHREDLLHCRGRIPG